MTAPAAVCATAGRLSPLLRSQWRQQQVCTSLTATFVRWWSAVVLTLRHTFINHPTYDTLPASDNSALRRDRGTVEGERRTHHVAIP